MRWELVTPQQRVVTERVLREESQQRRHLVVSLSGAHAYGFPSPDSDLDLKGIFVEPTPNLLGLQPPPAHANRMEVIEGVEVDYSCNELQAVLGGILAGNGNYIERVLGALIVQSSPEHESLQPLVKRSLSRRVYRHYQGFATSQLRAFEQAQAASAKKVLYVLRTTLTGAHLLRTGQLVTDVSRLIDDYGFGHARTLIEIKLAGERVALEPAVRASWADQLARAFIVLAEAHTQSSLPEESPNAVELEQWLLDVRRRMWDEA
jgi:predicted nucleotidyltransferase